MKKALCIALAVLMLLSIAPITAFAADEPELVGIETATAETADYKAGRYATSVTNYDKVVNYLINYGKTDDNGYKYVTSTQHSTNGTTTITFEYTLKNCNSHLVFSILNQEKDTTSSNYHNFASTMSFQLYPSSELIYLIYSGSYFTRTEYDMLDICEISFDRSKITGNESEKLPLTITGNKVISTSTLFDLFNVMFKGLCSFWDSRLYTVASCGLKGLGFTSYSNDNKAKGSVACDPVTGYHIGTTKTENQKTATCSENGYTGDVVCTGCGETIKTGSVIKATGAHIYDNSIDSICNNCGTVRITQESKNEPNSSKATATKLTLGVECADEIGSYEKYRKDGEDVDWFAFSLSAGKTYRVYVNNYNEDFAADTLMIALYYPDNDYDYIYSTMETNGVNYYEFEAESSGEYYLKLDNYIDFYNKSAHHPYSVLVKEIPKAPGSTKLAGVSNTATGIKITWNAVSGADTYIVYRKAGSAASWSKLATVKAGTTSYADSNVTAGTYYTYTVKATNASGSGGYNTSGLKTIRLLEPAVKLANKNGYINVSWGKIAGAKGYYVYRKAGSETSWTRIATIKDGATVSYNDKNIKSGIKYTYTVKAYNGSYTSSNKSVAILYLAQPTVTAANANSNVSVKWNKISGAKGYYVYRKAGSATSWTKIATIKDGATVSYTDKDIKNGTTYKYTVKAYNGSTYSAFCSGIAIKYLAPIKVTSATSSKSGITVKWGKNASVSGYYVYRKVGSGSWSKIATVKGAATVSYVDKSAKKGTTYTYCIRSYSGSYSGTYANTINCKDKY